MSVGVSVRAASWQRLTRARARARQRLYESTLTVAGATQQHHPVRLGAIAIILAHDWGGDGGGGEDGGGLVVVVVVVGWWGDGGAGRGVGNLTHRRHNPPQPLRAILLTTLRTQSHWAHMVAA